MSIKELPIKYNYFGNGKLLLNEFLLPVLTEATSYDRITSYYTIDSLLAISQGISALFEKAGKMRLILGIHSVPSELLDAVSSAAQLNDQVEQIRAKVKTDIASLASLLEKKRVATVAWMIEDGLLEIKAISVEGDGIFHPKALIISDADGNTVSAIGSPNETASGLGGNVEQLSVSKSWEIKEAVDQQKGFFDSLWYNKFDGVYCIDVTEGIANDIRESLGSEYSNPHKKNGIADMVQVISDSREMPTYFFVSGDVPALYMHQERAVIDALSRWPVRVLLSDEVGLGKTFEAAAAMVFLVKHCGIKRAIVLTPKSVLKQWQEELYDNFGLIMWLYDSNRKEYIAPDGKTIPMLGKNPLGPGSPDFILMSAQLARGSRADTNLFEKEDSVLPDLLVVDEAHSARVSRDITGKKKKTRLYKMLEAISPRIPHLILATATPMQTDAAEYHALLNLLGLPKQWQKERAFKTSLKIIGSKEPLDISDANTAAKLLCATVDTMSPSTNVLESHEKVLLEELKKLSIVADSYDIGSFVIDNWDCVRRIFVKLHPAKLLTVRNTRRSLSEVGYHFPKRNLSEISVSNSDRIQLFYQKVNDYITRECFSIEHALEPEKVINLGFIRVNYQQRVASSLHSCKESLSRRFGRALKLKNYLLSRGILEGFEYNLLDINESMDDIDLDELLDIGDENMDLSIDWNNIDVEELKRAVALECTSLGSLINQARDLLETPGDVKIIQSIKLALSCVSKGDAVLLFSRYTDTVEALIKQYKEDLGSKPCTYGVYTGQKSVIVKNGIEEACDKGKIKKELFNGTIKVMFCSDAASEGLNLQAARVLINVDVPWTPSRLEQRIGRIARLGQTADEVDVYNVWYPNSIEARMYHRIQKRLDETNLAIGEFPEIVANKIKEAVLEDSDTDDSIKQLNDLRNSYQMKALEELWVATGENLTTSSLIRKLLVKLGENRFDLMNTQGNGEISCLQMPDGTVIEMTSESGMAQSISLSSHIWDYTDYAIPNIKIKTSSNGIPITFYSNQIESILKPESIFKIALGDTVVEDMILENRPTILPDNNALKLVYSIECTVPKAPNYWPPIGEEEHGN